MKTVFNIIGRLALVAAAVLLCINGIPTAIDTVKLLNAGNGWWQFGVPEYREAMITLGLTALNLLGAIVAVIGALRGRRGVILILFAIGLIAYPVYYVAMGIKNQTITADWNVIWGLIKTFLAPILYFLGTIFLIRNDD